MAQRIIDDDKLRSYSVLYNCHSGPWCGKQIRLSNSFQTSLIMTVNGQKGFYKATSARTIAWEKV